jgi:hypothetical protein
MARSKLGLSVAPQSLRRLCAPQSRLGSRAACVAYFLSLIERGLNSPSFDVLEKMGRRLRVPVMALFDFQKPTGSAKKEHTAPRTMCPSAPSVGKHHRDFGRFTTILWYYLQKAFPSPRRNTIAMYAGCEECREVWRQYSIATAIHVQLDNKLRFAALQNDLALIETLTRETEGAEKTRDELRESIREHEGSHRSLARLNGCEPSPPRAIVRCTLPVNAAP